jgi:hypothetical protein
MNTPFRMALVAAGWCLPARCSLPATPQMNQAGRHEAGRERMKQGAKEAGRQRAGPALADPRSRVDQADFLKDPDLSVLKIDVDTKDGVLI